MAGNFCISLDFELYWGSRDKVTIDHYKKNLDGTKAAVLKLLELFDKYNIAATWAVVGFLYFQNQQELLQYKPKAIINFSQKRFCPYHYIETNELKPCYHFASEIIDAIKRNPYQELATHTFSHSLLLESKLDLVSFEADLRAHLSLDPAIKSIVFARNQFKKEHLQVCQKLGLKVFRGNEQHWLYRQNTGGKESKLKRLLRLVDTYINISGYQTQTLEIEEGLINIRSSRFLRPYKPVLKQLEPLKLRRIKKALEYAALNDRIFHLWWHPHNFGIYTEENLKFLEQILTFYQILRNKYNMANNVMKAFV